MKKDYRNMCGIKTPRKFTFRGKTYNSINSFCKEMQSKGYKLATLGRVRVALDLGRDLDKVINGCRFPRKSSRNFVYNGVEYPSANEFYRCMYKRRKRVYLTKESFVACIRNLGLETAIDHLLHKRLSNAQASENLGGSRNLVCLRLKHGWSYNRAINQPKQIKTKRKRIES